MYAREIVVAGKEGVYHLKSRAALGDKLARRSANPIFKNIILKDEDATSVWAPNHLAPPDVTAIRVRNLVNHAKEILLKQQIGPGILQAIQDPDRSGMRAWCAGCQIAGRGGELAGRTDWIYTRRKPLVRPLRGGRICGWGAFPLSALLVSSSLSPRRDSRAERSRCGRDYGW
ncbi:hypothetical protein BD779DRAFT_1477634 [Infundibulicybe gibba]|nr:hypothetical protein BD779DRAFT_1477634 [Infundibulicybe gibba]